MICKSRNSNQWMFYLLTEFGFTGSTFNHPQKPIADYVSVIQPRPQLSQFTPDYTNDTLNILDKPHRPKDSSNFFNSSSPASCHSPRHHGKFQSLITQKSSNIVGKKYFLHSGAI